MPPAARPGTRAPPPPHIPPTNTSAPVLNQVILKQGRELAVAVGLTRDPTDDVAQYLRHTGIPVGELIVLTTTDGPGPNAIPGAAFALGWAHTARVTIRNAVADAKAPRLHLFFAAPAGAVLMLGHHWNLLPPTIVYEHLNPGYTPIITVN